MTRRDIALYENHLHMQICSIMYTIFWLQLCKSMRQPFQSFAHLYKIHANSIWCFISAFATCNLIHLASLVARSKGILPTMEFQKNGATDNTTEWSRNNKKVLSCSRFGFMLYLNMSEMFFNIDNSTGIDIQLSCTCWILKSREGVSACYFQIWNSKKHDAARSAK